MTIKCWSSLLTTYNIHYYISIRFWAIGCLNICFSICLGHSFKIVHSIASSTAYFDMACCLLCFSGDDIPGDVRAMRSDKFQVREYLKMRLAISLLWHWWLHGIRHPNRSPWWTALLTISQFVAWPTAFRSAQLTTLDIGCLMETWAAMCAAKASPALPMINLCENRDRKMHHGNV